MSDQQYLRPLDLMERWGGAITIGTLANWRAQGRGPGFVKFGGRVLYPLDQVKQYEATMAVSYRERGDG